ncbi:MAG: cupin domain-containing protein, partial [Thermomicrobiales bacterium]|nr:cupin domain-containing protein [Thermomicrobiales bacterium]
MKTRITVALWVVLAILVAATQGSQQSKGSDATPTAASGLTRVVLAGATPAAAPDQSLQLARIDIAPGTKLPHHVHPGTQLASIVSGELTYTVLEGEIRVERAAIDGVPGPVEILKTGETTVLRPGDAVIETEGMVHDGENLGTETVVIMTAVLFEAGQPASIAV